MKNLETENKEDFLAGWMEKFNSDSFDLNPIGFNQAEVIFHVRYITDDEAESVFKRLRELVDKTDHEQRVESFPIYKDALRMFSTQSPSFRLNGKVENSPKSVAETLDLLFPSFDLKAWKVLKKAWSGLLIKNEPDEVFS